jgi:hypothetical protein
MRSRGIRRGLVGFTTLVLLAASGCGAGGGTERSLDDAAGDVPAATGPDVVGVAVERDDDTITFRVRFATAPPLDLSDQDGWVDMLLVGIDVPPLGAAPVSPGGEWRGADFACGTHGPSASGLLVRLAEGGAAPTKRATIPIETDGATLSLSIPRSELGDPEKFAVSIAAAREWNEPGDEPTGARFDIAPDSGTWAVDLEG